MKAARLITHNEARSNTLKSMGRVDTWVQQTLHPKKKKKR